MLGHQLMQALAPAHDVRVTLRQPLAAYRESGLFSERNALGEIDARDSARLAAAIERLAPQVVINCIGLVKQRPDAKTARLAIEVNALFPHELREMCERAGARLVHFSTDCVFSGRTGGYRETDLPDPVDLYGRSKLIGEVVDPPALTLRTSIVGLELGHKTGLVEWFLAQHGAIRGYRRAIFTGVTTLEIGRLVARIVERHRDLHGLWHVASAPISKYDLLVALGRKLNRTDIEVLPDETVACDRSLRAEAFHAATGYEPPSWDEMIGELAAQVERRTRGVTS
jgi:dTDP-4-dehydrorhamnose reductase